MKAQNRKVVQAVMKSPSPDIAHRSIIANTKSPVNQIKEYIRMRQSSTSPKSMTTSFHQISKSFSSENDELNRLRRYIQELQGKIKFLEKIHNSHDQLALINQSLNNQIAQLKTQLRQQRQRSHSNTSIKNISSNNLKPHSPKNGGKGVSLVRNSVLNANPQIQNIPQPTQNDSILRQFNERIVKMSQENKRLTKKMKEIKDERDYFEKQNSLLRIKGLSEQTPPTHSTASSENDLLKRYFTEEVDKVSVYYQRINEDKMSKLRIKLSQVQAELSRVLQKKDKKTYTRSNTPNELKANISMDTNIRSDNQDQGPSSLPANRYHMVESKYTTSPSEFKAFTLDTSPIRVLEEEKDKVKRENDYLSRKASQLQKDLKNALMTNDSLEKRLRKLQAQARGDSEEKQALSDSNFSMYKTAQEKNEYLESEIAKRNACITHNENKIHELQENLNKLKQHNDTMSKDYMKNIDQERQKNLKYLQDIQNLQAQITFFEQNYLSKEKYFFLQKELRELKDSYNRYKVDFERYLEMVLQIRYSITGQGVEQCLKEVESKWEGYDDLEVEIVKVHECYESLLENLKKKLLEKDQRIAQLQRDNQILLQQNQEIKVQLQKVQRAVKEYKQPVRSAMSQEQLRKRMAIHQQTSGKKPRQHCQIRSYINQTVTKISSLENEIEMAIKGNFTERLMDTSFRHQQRSAVNVDSFYRTGKGSASYSKADHDYLEESDPQQIQDEDVHIKHQ